MPERLIRTFAASSILVALAVAGIIQVASGPEPGPVEIVDQAVDSAPGPDGDAAIADSSTSAPVVAEDRSETFVYQVGLLHGISTDNFWEYFGSDPTVWDAYVLASTKASLFRVDPVTLEIVPELALDYAAPTWNSEGWRVTVALRDDMKWSDGIRLTASDISFTFRTVRALKLGGQWDYVFPAAVTDVRALDDSLVEIRFATRPSLQTWPYGTGTSPIMASHVWGPKLASVADASALFALDGADDVAGGLLQLVETGEDRIVAQANPGYPDNDAAPIVEFVVFSSEGEAVQGLIDGRVQMLASPNGLNPEQLAQLDGAEGISTVTSPKFGVRYLGFNTGREPMNEIAFRKAVDFLIDREQLASEVAHAPAASTMLPSAATAWYDDAASEAIAGGDANDLTGVITGLKEIGYTWSVEPALVDGVLAAGKGLQINARNPAPLTILTSGDSYDPARPVYADRIATAIELLGFDVIPVTTDFASVVDLTFTPDDEGKVHFDMALLGWSLGNPGLPGFYGELFGSTGAANNTGYASKLMDRLVGLLNAATTREEAKQVIWKIESLVADDLPYLPLYSSQITEAYRSDLVAFPDVRVIGGFQAALAGIEMVAPQTPGN